ncbi:MAG TPA: di-heme oxidoredictase family protein [Thermoanaerobaculia bacterium]|nr:di-heme oxidoredictase family protein [Thermoanaerobaculia bacterium]
MKRFTIVVFCISIALVSYAQARRRAVDGSAGVTQTVPQPAGASLTGLTAAQSASFNAGRGQFVRDWDNRDGLGPVFNERSCVDCHNGQATGGGSARLVTRFATRVGGVYDPLTSLGGSLLQDHAIGGNGPGQQQHNFVPEQVPAQATIVVQRRTTPLFGLGLVDATPDSEFIALAAFQAARGDGVAGRVNMTDNLRAGTKTVGRFGWKAQVPTLFQFSGDAMLNEMGITTPDFPNENCPQGNCAELTFNPAPGINDTVNTQSIANYMTLLAAPDRGPASADSIAGEQLFESTGCSECHVSTLTTGSSAIASLDHRTYHPYSDFLLHDMGTLGDGLEMASSTGAEMRTEPLWGLRFVTRYLHDGRATTLDAAITAHDGQGRAAKDRYTALTASEKAQLIAFLRSL